MTAKSINKVVILGANGAMGSGSGALFAASGIQTVLVARTLAKAEAGRARAEQLGKGKVPAGAIACATFDVADLEDALRDADLVLEAVSEDIAVKRELFATIDRIAADQLHERGLIVATVSSGLSIGGMCADRSEGFRRCFLGVHLFNPPTVIVGCELIAHAGTDPGVVALIRHTLSEVLRREVVETRDTPAFAGNRLGFRVLNEVAQYAEQHGPAFMDQLIGGHTGRALAPLATIDLVGWDVHKAIVDNLYASTHDVAHERFKLPAYMEAGIALGVLGRKAKNGFFKQEGKGPEAQKFVLDPATGDYRPWAEVAPAMPDVVTRMRAALTPGPGGEVQVAGAMEALCAAAGREADLLRTILLGYISYGLGLVGEVVERARDIDRIMAFGFHWAPPGMLVDAIGARRVIALLDQAKLPIPRVVTEAAANQRALWNEQGVAPAKFFTV